MGILFARIGNHFVEAYVTAGAYNVLWYALRFG